MIEKRSFLFNDKGDTWPKVLTYNYNKYGDSRVALRYKRYGIWQRYTWQDYYLDAKYLALGLLSIGFTADDKLVIVGDNASQWYCSALAAQSNRGIVVGLNPDLSPTEIKHLVENSEAKFAVAEGQEQVDKLIQTKNELPHLQKIIYWNYKGLSHYNDRALLGYQEIIELGKQYGNEHQGLFEENVKLGNANDVCTIVYTSGTTGATPKGAVHTYKTMMSGAKYFLSLDEWHEEDNVVFSLPPAGMTEQWLGIGCHLLLNNILNFAEQPETQQEDFREIGPDIVYYESQLWEHLAGVMQSRMRGVGTLARLVFRIFMPVSYKIADLDNENEKPGLLLKIFYSLAHLCLFGPIKDKLGLSKARICRTSGAVLSPDALKFYHALNIPLKNTYGTTECGGICGITAGNTCFESVGTIPIGTEIRITDDGEIICRQAGIFTGYYRNTDNTAEVLKNSWFHTGDSAAVDENGYVIYKGRIKDIFELPGGDKVSPQLIESRLRFSPHIKDAWVLTGPGKSYITAVIIINYENVSKWADQNKLVYTTFNDLSQKAAVYELIKQDIKRINETLSPGSRIKKYVNLYKEFDPDEGELTRTKKLRRGFLEEKYNDLIDAIYSDVTEMPIEVQVRYRDGRIGTVKTTISIKAIEEVTAL